jgi:hypothetical protein
LLPMIDPRALHSSHNVDLARYNDIDSNSASVKRGIRAGLCFGLEGLALESPPPILSDEPSELQDPDIAKGLLPRWNNRPTLPHPPLVIPGTEPEPPLTKMDLNLSRANGNLTAFSMVTDLRRSHS